MLTYHESRPDEDLRAHVHAFWTWRATIPAGDTFEHHVWPDGCVSLLVSQRSGAAPGGVVVGPCVEARCLPMTGDVVTRGVRFRPEAGAAVIGLRAADLTARTLPLTACMSGDAAAALIDAVSTAAASDSGSGTNDREALAPFANWTRVRLAQAAPLDTLVARAVDAMRDSHGQIVMAALASTLGLSPRQLQRRFLAAVGLTPKQYARIRRLRSLLAVVLEQDEAKWSALAAEAGYADQAHCARELARLTGLPPRALAVRLRSIQHDGVEP